MQIERINPPMLQPQGGLTHVAKVTGGTTLYLSGQGAYDSENTLVGPGDHYAQAKQAFANVATALQAAGADVSDIVKATYYIRGLTDETMMDFARAMFEVPGLPHDALPASTMVGVDRLGYDEMLVEIEVIAVIP